MSLLEDWIYAGDTKGRQFYQNLGWKEGLSKENPMGKKFPYFGTNPKYEGFKPGFKGGDKTNLMNLKNFSQGYVGQGLKSLGGVYDAGSGVGGGTQGSRFLYEKAANAGNLFKGTSLMNMGKIMNNPIVKNLMKVAKIPGLGLPLALLGEADIPKMVQDYKTTYAQATGQPTPAQIQQATAMDTQLTQSQVPPYTPPYTPTVQPTVQPLSGPAGGPPPRQTTQSAAPVFKSYGPPNMQRF
jgi:hypothetical protein